MMIDLSPYPLTRLILDARAGRTTGEAVLAECSLFVYGKLRRIRGLDEDVRQDFYIAFLPYLKKFMDRFEYRGISLECCLSAILKKRLNSFYRSLRHENFLWSICQDPSFAPAYSPENPVPSPQYARLAELLRRGPDGRFAKAAARKWYVVWMLKHCRHLSAADFAITARLSGCDEGWLRERADTLVRKRRSQDLRLDKLRRRRNRLFVNARLLELRLRRELDEETREVLSVKIERTRRSLHKAVNEISRVSRDPSHSMVARALGLPKGTVDTIMSRIQRLLESRAGAKEIATA
ncbi:MAG: hypothetical protein JXD23_12540 [Spirochaetales bacterium]|nr:hypothetical protein [Spirochaetales bacterium]